MTMKNWFFQQAISRATRLAGHPGRILNLIVQLSVRLYQTDFKSLKAVHVLEKFGVLSRVASAYARGHYRDIPWKTILTVMAALVYFVNPLDLVPDALPGLGLTDDFTVLLWVYSSADVEIKKFLLWESGIKVQTANALAIETSVTVPG